MAFAGLNGRYNAMDSTQHYSVAQLREMRARGIDTMFRYLAGGGSWKQLNQQDVRNFREAGMDLALIYQERGREAGDFTRAEGREAARETIRRARELGLPDNATVYFAVDYDASDRDVANNIIPYFQALQEELRAQGSSLKVGIYGGGAVCQAVHGAGLAERTWLAGASGWRGSQEFFRSGRWDVVQQIVGDRDYNVINPLTQGLGSVNFDQGRAYVQAMGPGASTVDPATAARNLQAWLDSDTTGDTDHDTTRDEFYRRAQRWLGLDQQAVRDALAEGGPLAVILIFFMFLLVGVDKMNDIGTTGRSERPNTPPPPGTYPSPFSTPGTPPTPAAATPAQALPMPEVASSFEHILGNSGMDILRRLVAQGVEVDIAGPNGSGPDRRFDDHDIAAMAARLQTAQVAVEQPGNASMVVSAYANTPAAQQRPAAAVGQ